MMPNYDLGDRKIGVLPQVQSPDIRWGEMGREVASAGDAVAGALDRIRAVRVREAEKAAREAERASLASQRAREAQDRADEREAQYRVAEGVNWFKNQWNGQDVQDEKTGEWKHIPGVVDRTWQEMEADKTSALDEMSRLKREFRESEIYTAMNPSQRLHFDRAWKFKEDEFQRAASARHAELKQSKIVTQNKVLDGADDSEVLQVATADADTFEATAHRAAARKLFRRYGTSANAEVDPSSPEFSVYDIELKGAKANDPETQARYTELYRQHRELVKAYRVNRVTNLMRVAERDVPGADQLLAEARITAWALEGKNAEGMELWIDQGVDDKGNRLPAVRDHMDISEIEAKGLHSDIDRAEKKLTELREQKVAKAKEENFTKYKAYVGDFELALLDPKKIDETVLDYESFESRLAEDPNLTDAQEQTLLKRYRELITYQQKYRADLAEARAEIAAGVEEDKLVHGFFREDGAFIPSSAFPEKSQPATVLEFAESGAMWQNPKTALIKVESARMTGRLSKADYMKHRAYGEMLLDKKANEAWLKIYPNLKIEDAQELGIGTAAGDLTEEQRKARKKWKSLYGENSTHYRFVQNGIYAKTRGNVGGVDWLADSLEGGTDEEFIPPETMTEVYRTVIRFARAGVDPIEAIRQIIAPTVEDGVMRSLQERLRDPDYFQTILNKARRESGYFDDLDQAKADQFDKSNQFRRGTGNRDEQN